MKHEGVSQKDITGPNFSAEHSHGIIERRFYVSAALFVILLSVAGFGPSIIDPSRRNAPSTQLVLAHGIIASTWLVLFLSTNPSRRIGHHFPRLQASSIRKTSVSLRSCYASRSPRLNQMLYAILAE